MAGGRLSIFTQYAKNVLLQVNQETSHSLLKEQSQIPLLIDILSQQKHHHLLLLKSFSNHFNDAIIETLAYALSTIPTAHVEPIANGAPIVNAISSHCAATTSVTMKEASVIYFDVTGFMLSAETKDDIENDFRILCDTARINNKTIIFVMNQLQPLITKDQSSILNILGKQLKSILMNNQWRVIILMEPNYYQDLAENNIFLNELFTTIKINEPTEIEMFILLKKCRLILEQLHSIVLPEEVLHSAMSLADTYFAGYSVLDKAFELLDTAAMRISTGFLGDIRSQKHIMTIVDLLQITSHWTGISLTYLQNNTFQSEQLADALRQIIFGQDQAIKSITSLLQNACIKLHKTTGPLCSLMLVGPAYVGKSSLVNALSQQLYGHYNAILRVNLNSSICRLMDIRVNIGFPTIDNIDLFSALQQTSYAILFFQNVEKFSEEMRNVIKNILAEGIIYDEEGKKYDFRHTIIIISTTVKTEHIVRFMQAVPEQGKQIDLMQLMLDEDIQDPFYFSHQNLQDKIVEQLFPELSAHFSKDILELLHIIPCLPLDLMAIEKIIHNKLLTFKKRLETLFGIDLQYAAEIIKFLSHEALLQHTNIKSLEKILETYLYTCVSKEIMRSMNKKHHTQTRLLLQLHENGQSLKCEFVATHEATFV